MRVLTVFGTRPEAIKMAPLVKKLEEEPSFESVLCVSGQHRKMLDQVLEAFSLTPDFDLSIMQETQTLTSITTRVLSGFTPILKTVQPDLVLVHGDTTTSMSAALGAFYEKIPVAHIEAGLRTNDRYSPFPEEVNRKLITILSSYHFAPTQKNKENLADEGVCDNVWVTGNTVLDSFAYTLKNPYAFQEPSLNALDFDRPIVLVTAHRRENLGEPLKNICMAVKVLCKLHPNCQIVYPVHFNPAVRKTVYSMLDQIPNVFLINPIDVLDMHNLMARSYFVMTDSGGLQEEAPYLNKPVLVLRRETERREVIDSGAAILTGTSKESIIEKASSLLSNNARYREMANAACPYGDGKAAERIVTHLRSAFRERGES